MLLVVLRVPDVVLVLIGRLGCPRMFPAFETSGIVPGLWRDRWLSFACPFPFLAFAFALDRRMYASGRGRLVGGVVPRISLPKN